MGKWEELLSGTFGGLGSSWWRPRNGLAAGPTMVTGHGDLPSVECHLLLLNPVSRSRMELEDGWPSVFPEKMVLQTEGLKYPCRDV